MNLTQIENMLLIDEGMELFPYKCTANKWTIGVGRNIEEKGISKAEAMFMLKNDIRECYLDLQKIFEGFHKFPEQIQYVLINMRFQLGQGGFRSFKNMIHAFKHSHYKQAALEMQNSKWHRQTTKRANRLINIVKGFQRI